jgi:hypothetical protein
MLAPEDRRLYSACFSAPDGYDFDAAVGTTYSLDLDCLLFALFSLAASGAQDPESALADPVSVLEAIHRTRERVMVFCHAGETNVPRRPQALYGLVEACLHPALGRGGAIFHPKLWLLRFRAKDGSDALIRTVVLSRNLTASRAWDTFICLEGTPGQNLVLESSELGALVRALPDLSVQGQALSPEQLNLISSFAFDAERTAFSAPGPFEGTVSFEAFGIGNGRTFEAHAGDRLLAVSPFVSPDTLEHLRQLAPAATLVGRAEEMAKCPGSVIEAWKAFTLHERASSDADLLLDQQEVATADAAPQGLHAKALAVESGDRTTWWLGSGNLTDPVRSGASVELLVRLAGKTSRVGVTAFIDAGFGQLLVPYQHQPAVDDPVERSRSAVGRAKRQIVERSPSLHCEARDGAWDLLLEGAHVEVDGVVIDCRPVTLGVTREKRWQPGVTRYCFERLAIESLGAFVSFRLRAGQGESHFEHCFTLKLAIVGLPAGRDPCIARSIIKDRAAFMSYLRHLLADLGDELEATVDDPSHGEPVSGQRALASTAGGVLESLLRTLHRQPRRLQGLRSLLAQTAATPDDSLPIPEEFRAVWAAIEPHLPSEGGA